MGNFITGLLCEEHLPKPALLATLVLLIMFVGISVADFVLFVQTGKHWPNYGVFAGITGGGGGMGPYAMHVANSYLNAPRGQWPVPPTSYPSTGGKTSATSNAGSHPDNG
jgi:hypothetical protein